MISGPDSSLALKQVDTASPAPADAPPIAILDGDIPSSVALFVNQSKAA